MNRLRFLCHANPPKSEIDHLSSNAEVTFLPGAASTEPDLEALSRIIQDVNERFGTEFTEADKVMIHALKTHLSRNDLLIQSIQSANSRQNLKLLFNSLFLTAMQDLAESNFDLYKKVTDDDAFGTFFKERIFDAVYADLRPTPSPVPLGDQYAPRTTRSSVPYQ